MLNYKVKQPLQSQNGSIIIEGLIAILIFSMGILAIVGLQAASIKSSSDSQYRMEASFFASRINSEMWASYSTLNAFSTSPTYVAWINNVQARLPGANTIPPVVTLVGSQIAGYTATVRVNWQAPGDPEPHNYTAISYIQQ